SASLTISSRSTPAHTPLYPLSLHDALPILHHPQQPSLWFPHSFDPFFHSALLPSPHHRHQVCVHDPILPPRHHHRRQSFVFHSLDRKSTRLNSSHVKISYAVFCLKKKK